MSSVSWRRRRRGSRLTTLCAVVLVGTTLAACRMTAGVPEPAAGPSADPEAPAGGLTVGVLGSRCDADRVSALRAAGVRLVEIGVRWRRFEPEPGQFDQAYIDMLRARLARCANAGLGV